MNCNESRSAQLNSRSVLIQFSAVPSASLTAYAQPTLYCLNQELQSSSLLFKRITCDIDIFLWFCYLFSAYRQKLKFYGITNYCTDQGLPFWLCRPHCADYDCRPILRTIKHGVFVTFIILSIHPLGTVPAGLRFIADVFFIYFVARNGSFQ